MYATIFHMYSCEKTYSTVISCAR